MIKQIFLLCSLILATQSFSQEKSVTVEKIYNYEFYPESLQEINSMKDGLSYVRLEKTGIERYDYLTQSKLETIVNGKYDGYSFSEDENFVLLQMNTTPIFRRSKKAVYHLYNRTKKTSQILFNGKQIQEPTLSPKNDKVAFTFENNIYIQDLKNNKITTVTNDGVPNKIINGTTDWVYEEEFTFVKAFHWNKTGDFIAYLRFDETDVPEFSMDVYGNSLYPKQHEFKYPKAGEKNAKVSLYLYNTQKGFSKKIDTQNYEYIPRLKWTNEASKLSYITMNRNQSELNLNFYDVNKNKSERILTEKSETYVDLELNNNFTFLEDNQFIWASEKSGYNHLYLYNNNGTEQYQITSGAWQVTDFYGFDNDKKKIYYQSTENGSINRGIYSIDIDGNNKKGLAIKAGTNEAVFSSTFSYFIHTFSDAETPYVYTLNEGKSGNMIKVIKDNSSLKNKLKEYKISYKTFSELRTLNGQKLNSWIIKPLDFDSNKKYPVLMFQYSGPGSQQVANQWMSFNDFWYQQLAEMGYIIVCVDGRGTGYKGADFKKSTYKKLGKLEVEDQISAAKTIAQKPYVDENRIGIWGWSYGGFMSSNCILKGNDIFKMAIAVAPVTNWRYYDTVYTERYMQTPQENESGYDDNSPVFHAEKLKGKYLLIHGTGDDNVHVQNAMAMVNALVTANKQFDQFIYPDRNHGIYGGNTRIHLFNMITDYIKNNL